jgi:hypothetical protein
MHFDVLMVTTKLRSIKNVKSQANHGERPYMKTTNMATTFRVGRLAE